MKNISTLVTVESPLMRRSGNQMQDIGVIKNADVVINNDIIEFAGTSELNTNSDYDVIIDCSNKTVVPGFVDSHTHIVFSGERSGELVKRLKGVTYMQIAEEGGGIKSTMMSVRKTSKQEILQKAKMLALSSFKYGTTTIEIKSGYGLDYINEIKLLEVISDLKLETPQTIVATFLGAHDIPPEYSINRTGYINEITEQMLPEISKRNLATFCDVFSDNGYFTTNEARQIFLAAKQYGLQLKLHADELSSFGGAELASEVGAISADHLLRISNEGILSMLNNNVVATLLPGTAFFLGLDYAPARKMISEGLCVALGSDCNPGSNMCENLQMTMALATMGMKMTIEETICAVTINGAAALGLADKIGSIEVGKNADMLIFNCEDYPEIVYHYGINMISGIVKNGVFYKN
ncbi:MAG: imidazolonepropionase [Chlorobiota bacterium]|nr:MAG: imidazolonepropionase [Chlorobiota bacterium]